MNSFVGPSLVLFHDFFAAPFAAFAVLAWCDDVVFVTVVFVTVDFVTVFFVPGNR